MAALWAQIRESDAMSRAAFAEDWPEYFRLRAGSGRDPPPDG
jgi:hypothetical protein